MSAPGMFREKISEGVSMTRVIAFGVALSACLALLLYAWRAAAVTWPLAAVLVAALFAVPVQGWLRSRAGRAALSRLADAAHDRIGGGDA